MRKAVNHRDAHLESSRAGQGAPAGGTCPSQREERAGWSRRLQGASLYIYQVGLPQEGLRGGDITEVLQRCFLLQGKPRILKCFFLANCEEEGLPRRVLGLIHFSPSIEEALMPCPVVFSLEHTVGEDQDKSGPAGLDSETFTLRHSSKLREGTSLPVQCLRLCLPMQGGEGSIPG